MGRLSLPPKIFASFRRDVGAHLKEAPETARVGEIFERHRRGADRSENSHFSWSLKGFCGPSDMKIESQHSIFMRGGDPPGQRGSIEINPRARGHELFLFNRDDVSAQRPDATVGPIS